MVHSQKISIPVPRNVIENSEGEFQMPKFLKRNCKAKLEFPKGWEGSNQKTSVGGVWIFSGTTYFMIRQGQNHIIKSGSCKQTPDLMICWQSK